MATNKTQPTPQSVTAHIRAITDEQKRQDAQTLTDIMAEATGFTPVLWGPSIIGFGNYHYIYDSGREGDTPVVSFAVRKSGLVLYGVMFYHQNADNVALVKKLGPYTMGKGCLYLKSLTGIDLAVLRTMIMNAVAARSDTI
jgi:hypothetical protein